MFPSRYRLPLRHLRDFFRAARRLSTPHFMVFSTKSEDRSEGETARVALSVPKHLLAKSTQRNALKRQLRQSLTPLLARATPADMVISPKRSLLRLSKAEMEEVVKKELGLGK